ncbi:MAG TPA: hypothetical protein VHA74_03945, partial [Candidatus Dojkabacteria bacterium]|nr:hypothetical protein [Candidatus Dojkabacteria bacterium]
AFVISELATNAVFEVGKGVLQILSVIVILILAIFGFIFFYSTNVLFHNPIASAASYRYVVPGSTLQCTNYNPDSLNYVDSGDTGGDNFPPVNSTCPFTFSPQICTQGHGTNSSLYHQLKKAMDVGTNSIPEAVWYAPTDGKITHFSAVNYSIMCAGVSYGGWLEFTDSDGNVYVLLHVKAVAPIGGKILKGHAVAVAQRDIETSDCWSGPHFHTEVRASGSYVDADDWYINKLKCPISQCQ